ncbi:MAG TPA: CBS domain-containing protein [Candidatus Lokiarchaeia archaeon]|nr:CBS domain-containing protein [Candidatus Lokiarchaeia archaeon]
MSSQKRKYLVKDLVIDDEYSTIDCNATVREAAEKMKEAGVPDLVVLNPDDGSVLGVIADFDIVHEIVAEGKDPGTENVCAGMYKIEPVTLDTPVEDAFVRMRDLKVTVVPVVQDGKLMGVCTIHDCWSYVPQEGASKTGLIPVSNAKLSEFWLSGVCAIAAFILGILLPMTGVFGYFSDSASAFPHGGPSGMISFSLFTVHGIGSTFSINYFNLATTIGFVWILMIILGFALLVFSIIGSFSMAYSGYSAMRGFHIEKFHLRAFPILMVLFIAVEWIFLAVSVVVTEPSGSLQIDPVGLICSIVAVCLTMLVVFRDRMFVQKEQGGA